MPQPDIYALAHSIYTWMSFEQREAFQKHCAGTPINPAWIGQFHNRGLTTTDGEVTDLGNAVHTIILEENP